MSLAAQTILGVVLVSAAWLMSRWAARYDVKSWFTDALWRGVWGIFRDGAWRKPREISMDKVVASDPILKKQITDKIAEVKSDSARLGTTRTAVKHGGLYALAYVVSLISGPLTFIGMLVLAHAAYRWMS